MKNNASGLEITEEVLRAAREHPNGWVYKIEGSFGPTEIVPPEAVVGAWKVNANGDLTGEFVLNKKYLQQLSKEEK